MPILILAAGASRRMGGRDKLLESIDGESLLAGRVSAALATGAPVFVALPPRRSAPDRWAEVEAQAVQAIEVTGAQAGLAASLVAGLAALPPDARGLLVMLADMPEITSADLARLLAQFDGDTILRAASETGAAGNPVVFPARDFSALAALTGDRGARDYLKRERARVRLVRLAKAHALTDLDTPQDWARWRAARESPT